jgi:hypothetical protein
MKLWYEYDSDNNLYQLMDITYNQADSTLSFNVNTYSKIFSNWNLFNNDASKTSAKWVYDNTNYLIIDNNGNLTFTMNNISSVGKIIKLPNEGNVYMMITTVAYELVYLELDPVTYSIYYLGNSYTYDSTYVSQ